MLIFVYKTRLSAALWKRFSPEPVDIRYHLQKALLRLSLGYSFNPISIFPLNLRSDDILSTVELFPAKLFTIILKADSFFSLILALISIERPKKTFLRTTGFNLGLSACLAPVIALNPGIYFPTTFR